MKPDLAASISNSKSPCIGKCAVAAGVCVGCKRSLSEIIEWSNLSLSMRISINKRIQEI